MTLKFDAYKKQSNHTLRQHLTIMSNMISELRCVGHELTDEQQVQVMIHSLPSALEHLRINLTQMATSRLLMMLHEMTSLRRIVFSLISLMESLILQSLRKLEPSAQDERMEG